MRPYLLEMTSADCMCQEKKKEEDLRALNIASMHRYKDSKITLKMQRKIDYSDQNQYKQQELTEQK